MHKLSPLSKVVKLAVLSGLAYSSVSTQAFAAEDEVTADIEKIAIVGSRAAPRSVNDSPVPVDIISSDEMAKNGSTDMLDMLQTSVPSFNVRAQPISDAATLIRPVNLRGLSSDSTLILVNGKRRHRASVIAFQGGGVNDGAQGPDISVIPSVALKQVEVLRDGAAAQYGSDAIAGVMNFALKNDSEGGSISVRQGEFFEGDGAATTIDGNIGLPLTEDGFLNLSFQLKNADATSRSVQRPDAANLAVQGNTSINNPAQIWGNPEIKDDLTFFFNSGIDVNENVHVYAFGNVSSREVTGGFYYRNPHNRGNVFSIDGGETLLVGDVGYAENGVSTCSFFNGPNQPSGVSIPRVDTDGDGIPDADGNILTDANYLAMVADDQCFSMNQLMPGGYTPQFGGEVEDMSFVAGAKGEFGEWSYDISYAIGNNKSTFFLNNSLNPSMGLASPKNFKTGAYEQSESTFNFDLVRELELGFAEPLNFATGFEWREESFDITAGEEASWIAGPYASQGFNIGSHGFKGFGPEAAGKNSRDNIGVYVDVETYLTEDMMVGAAVRYEDFSTFGDTLDYKITAQYSVTEDFSLRGSHSTGFRAPTVGQENVVNTQTSIVDGDLIQTFIAPPTNPLSAFYGGQVLQPEESTSFAIGAVYEYEDFFMTIDYYNIGVEGRIAQSSQIAVEAADHAELRALGVQNPELISAVTYYANNFDTTTQGIDLVATYEMELMGGDTKLSLAYNWTDTQVDSRDPVRDPKTGALKLDDDGNPIYVTNDGKVKRLEDGMPDHRATLTLAQSWDKLSMFVRGNYFGEYYATHADDTSEWGSEMADSAMTFDIEASYAITDSFTLSAGANNVFDQEAQELKKGDDPAYAILGAKYYESGPFDYNGGYYYVQGRYTF